jgi:hypothetical protein
MKYCLRYCDKFGGCIKMYLWIVSYGIQHAAFGVMQRAVTVACISFKYLHVIGQHFACRPKLMCAARSLTSASRSVGYAHNFLWNWVFGCMNKLQLCCNKLV